MEKNLEAREHIDPVLTLSTLTTDEMPSGRPSPSRRTATVRLHQPQDAVDRSGVLFDEAAEK
ncbi:hypothetical protein ACFYOT_04165 [Saccharothrix saharensis]|uniref:hypothetical protein n=1 Tax=Saccharothrix saharensis TaxID=571190 RepID=UPI0036A73D19